MVIKTQLTEKDFINVNFVILFSKPVIRIVFLIMAFTFILNLIPLSGSGEFTIMRVIMPIFVLGFLPAITYFAAKKNYSSDKRISEPIEYSFEKDHLKVQGESFNSVLTWNKIYKVTQTKRWILIWQSKQIANAIRKSDVSYQAANHLKKYLPSIT